MEITPDEDLITPERLAKGDLEVAVNLRGKISRAVPMRLTIARELIRRGSFPNHYEIYGVGFLELRNAFRAPWAARSSAVLLEQWGIGMSIGKANEIYEVVSRVVGTEKINIIQYVIEMKERRLSRSKKEILEKRTEKIDEYRRCFESLVTAMDAERERIQKELC